LSITLLFFLINSSGQSTDTIFLREIKVQNIDKKVSHIKTKGNTSSLSGKPIRSIISRIDQIPSGRLSSIKFYFNSNSLFFVPNQKKKDYQDVDFELLIYGIKEDGSPGEVIAEKKIRFKLKSDHKGSLELDLEPLQLNTSQSMYFGIELLKPQLGNDFRIMIKCDHNSNVLYMKRWNNDKWYTSIFGSGASCEIKMDLGIRLLN
jgi:hypothetical protein